MEFLNLINAIASHINVDNIEVVCEMLEKLIVLGDQMEAAAEKALSRVVSASPVNPPVQQ